MIRVADAAAALPLLALCATLGCGDPESGPVALHYDRDECERCRMAISDRRFAAQVRTEPGRRPLRFDDLGCALLWLDEHQEHGGEAASEIWVRDASDDRWLDAREAHYEHGQHTPMNFGFGASADAAPDSVRLDAVRNMVRDQERERRAADR